MENSEFSYHAPCFECGSKDNVAVYSDSHGHCFGCGHYYSTYEKQEVAMETKNKELVQGECGVDCISMTGAAVVNTDEDDIYLHYYLAKSKTINFVISIASTTQIEGGELDVSNIAIQMLSGK